METLELAYDELIGFGGVGAALAGALSVTGSIGF